MHQFGLALSSILLALPLLISCASSNTQEEEGTIVLDVTDDGSTLPDATADTGTEPEPTTDEQNPDDPTTDTLPSTDATSEASDGSEATLDVEEPDAPTVDTPALVNILPACLTVPAIPDDGKDDTATLKAALAECASGPLKTLCFPAGVLHLGTTTIPPELSIVVNKGTLFEVAAGKTLTVAGPFQAGQYQVFTGEGEVRFSSHREVLVDWFGAANDGSLDASAAINRAMAALPGEGNLVFGFGNYLLTEGLDPITTTRVTHVRGQGVDSTRLTFAPSTTATLFTFEPVAAGSLVWRSSLRDLAVYGIGDAIKTAISLLEVTEFILENVHVNNIGATDTESIGLKVYGRDSTTVRNVRIYAPRPLVIALSPYQGEVMGIDHWSFTDFYPQSLSPTHPLIEVEDGCNLSNVTFDGYQPWVGGNGGFYWDSSTKPTGDGINISFNNIRWEPGGVIPNRPTFYLKPNWQARQILFNNINCGTYTTGFYLRNLKSATFNSVNVSGLIPGCHPYDLDGTCDSILFQNFSSDQYASLPLVEGLTKLFSAGHTEVYPPETEWIKYYVNDNEKSESSRYFSIKDHRVWTEMTVIDGQTGGGEGFTIPGNPSVLGMAQLFVAYDEGTGTAGGGHFLISGTTPEGTTVKLSGTEDIVATRQAGKVSVFVQQGTDSIRILNDLGEPRTFSIIVYYSSESFPL